MTPKNQQIEAFLDSYYSMKSPQYAVMIKGSWGAGKTWFIKKSAERLKTNGGRYLYISLYGVSDFKGIEEEIFRQIHPVLGHKNSVLLGKVAKGFLKGMLKIDMDGNGTDDGNWSVSVPDISLPEYFSNVENNILIFDDIERCTVPIVNLLGYINYFVEHGGHKVILVANEDEIKPIEKKENNKEHNNKYQLIKEKLIGKTFEVGADVEAAVNAFIDEIDEISHKESLTKNAQLICEIYRASTYKNLRNLRQAVLEFYRLMKEINSEYLLNESLIKDMLSSFLIFTFEVRNGTLKASDISRINISTFVEMVGSDYESLSFSNLKSKYLGFVWFDK